MAIPCTVWYPTLCTVRTTHCTYYVHVPLPHPIQGVPLTHCTPPLYTVVSYSVSICTPYPLPVLPSVHTLTQYCTTSYTVLYHVPHTHCIGTYIHTVLHTTYIRTLHLHCTLYDTLHCVLHTPCNTHTGDTTHAHIQIQHTGVAHAITC